MAIYANHPIHDTFDRLELAKDFDENGRPYIEFDHSSEYSSRRERPNVLIAVTFLLELMILAFVIVLEYFMRWTDVFPVRAQNFSCVDPEISYSTKDSSLAKFAFHADVPIDAIYALSFCVPPFIITIGEIGVWAFSRDQQKVVRVMCKQCSIPQVIRRLFRFIGVFLFGAFTLLIFVDVIKFMVGRLRPNFLDVCQLNQTACGLQGNVGGDELCGATDGFALRDARTSFPSMQAALTAYSAVFISVYIHGAVKSHAVRVLRPFLALTFTMLSLLAGVSQIGLYRNYWTDVVVGFGMGIIMALYLGALVLNKFQEYLSDDKLRYMLGNFLVSQQRMYDMTREDYYGPLFYQNGNLHIPRAHMRSNTSSDISDGHYHPRLPLHDTFQRDLARGVEHYRRSNSHHTSHM